MLRSLMNGVLSSRGGGRTRGGTSGGLTGTTGAGHSGRSSGGAGAALGMASRFLRRR